MSLVHRGFVCPQEGDNSPRTRWHNKLYWGDQDADLPWRHKYWYSSPKHRRWWWLEPDERAKLLRGRTVTSGRAPVLHKFSLLKSDGSALFTNCWLGIFTQNVNVRLDVKRKIWHENAKCLDHNSPICDWNTGKQDFFNRPGFSSYYRLWCNSIPQNQSRVSLCADILIMTQFTFRREKNSFCLISAGRSTDIVQPRQSEDASGVNQGWLFCRGVTWITTRSVTQTFGFLGCSTLLCVML